MGIFDFLRRKRPINPDLQRIVEDYKRNLANAERRLAESTEAIYGGLDERESCVIEAAYAGLIQIPSHLASRLELLRRLRLESQRKELEAAVTVDELASAIEVLYGQSWWPDFVAGVRQRKGIHTAADIGRWGFHGKKIAPYVWECGFMFQTLEAVRNDGPVSAWSWRVNLLERTSEPI